jgi:hypothetical protein
MLTKPDLTTSQDPDKNYLVRLRRGAKKRGFRVLKDWTGRWSLVDAKIEPQQALFDLFHVSLSRIEATPAQAHHSFLTLVEALKTQGGAS